ncbi:MAG: hypothetical protein M0C28_03720 [Candidatus Moduliflexus flocculans]|nr:hypothetical protein [Candidatus Moduliflexus flocculans]
MAGILGINEGASSDNELLLCRCSPDGEIAWQRSYASGGANHDWATAAAATSGRRDHRPRAFKTGRQRDTDGRHLGPEAHFGRRHRVAEAHRRSRGGRGGVGPPDGRRGLSHRRPNGLVRYGGADPVLAHEALFGRRPRASTHARPLLWIRSLPFRRSRGRRLVHRRPHIDAVRRLGRRRQDRPGRRDHRGKNLPVGPLERQRCGHDPDRGRRLPALAERERK